MRALFVAPYYPATLRSWGHTRLSNLVKGLGARHEVHWLSLTSDADDLTAGRLEGLQADPVLILARNNETLGAKLWDACLPRHWTRSLSRCQGYLGRKSALHLLRIFGFLHRCKNKAWTHSIDTYLGC